MVLEGTEAAGSEAAGSEGEEGSAPDPARVPDAEVEPVGRHRRERVPVLSVPASVRSVELHVGRGAVRGMVLVAVVVVLVLAGRWWWLTAVAGSGEPVHLAQDQTQGQPVDESGEQLAAEAATSTAAAGPTHSAGRSSSAAAAADDQAPDGGGASGESGATGPLLIHVTGQVREPGVVEVQQGSRVIDAVRAAGGLTREADQTALNLARPVVDGEQVWVGRPGEEPPASVGSVPSSQVAPGAGQAAGQAGGQAGPPAAAGAAGPLDLNSATQADLEELPGVGPVTAGRILAWREERGRFTSVEELLEVSGIGERTLEQLEPHVTVGP